MRGKVILLAGTWAFSGTDSGHDWWRPGSKFYDEGKKFGLDYVNGSDPFIWDTKLDGVIGQNEVWQSAGHALLWYAHLKEPNEPVSVIAHSHGGNVLAYAARFGLKIDRAITVATPVRREVPYASLKQNAVHWTHIHGGIWDYVQILGELKSFSFTGAFRRKMRLADKNIAVPDKDHGELHDYRLWTEREWWKLLG
jgi:hypothetical protein